MERAAATFKCARQALAAALKGDHAFTSTLKCQDRENETNLGCRPRTPRQCLPRREDLGEGLVRRARIKVDTLIMSKEFVDIKDEAAGLPLHQQKQVGGDRRQGDLHGCSPKIQGKDGWMSPGRAGFNYRQGSHGQYTVRGAQHTIIKVGYQDGALDQLADINKFERTSVRQPTPTQRPLSTCLWSPMPPS